MPPPTRSVWNRHHGITFLTFQAWDFVITTCHISNFRSSVRVFLLSWTMGAACHIACILHCVCFVNWVRCSAFILHWPGKKSQSSFQHFESEHDTLLRPVQLCFFFRMFMLNTPPTPKKTNMQPKLHTSMFVFMIVAWLNEVYPCVWLNWSSPFDWKVKLAIRGLLNC